MIVTISTTIDADLYRQAKAKGAKWSHLIRLGWKAYNDNPQMVERIRELEGANDKLQRRLTQLSEKLSDIARGGSDVV